MSFDKIIDLTAGVCDFFFNIYIYYENKNTLQVRDRSFCRNSYLHAVCDTSIARMMDRLSSLRIWVGDSPWNYSIAVRVNRVMFVRLCAETIKPVSEGDKIWQLWKEMHQVIK